MISSCCPWRGLKEKKGGNKYYMEQTRRKSGLLVSFHRGKKRVKPQKEDCTRLDGY